MRASRGFSTQRMKTCRRCTASTLTRRERFDIYLSPRVVSAAAEHEVTDLQPVCRPQSPAFAVLCDFPSAAASLCWKCKPATRADRFLPRAPAIGPARRSSGTRSSAPQPPRRSSSLGTGSGATTAQRTFGWGAGRQAGGRAPWRRTHEGLDKAGRTAGAATAAAGETLSPPAEARVLRPPPAPAAPPQQRKSGGTEEEAACPRLAVQTAAAGCFLGGSRQRASSHTAVVSTHPPASHPQSTARRGARQTESVCIDKY